MELNLNIFISILSILGGLISIFVTISSVYYSYKSRKNKLLEAQERKFQNAMASDDLTTVGNFLYNTIGDFNVYEYVSNIDVSKTVDKYVVKLLLFIKTDAELKQEIDEIKEVEHITELEIPLELSEDFTKMLVELDSGERWNALARLRRSIEITLNEIAKANDIIIDRPSAGQLLNVLIRKKIIPIEAMSHLKYAISVCNQAIHGRDVSMNEAQEAVFHASIGLKILKTSQT